MRDERRSSKRAKRSTEKRRQRGTRSRRTVARSAAKRAATGRIPGARRGIRPEDFLDYAVITDFDVSPDGARVVYALRETDVDADRDRIHLWLASSRGLRQLTFGAVRDRHPRFSPDGKTIAFVSGRSGVSQIWVMRVDGGEPRQLTRRKDGAGTPVWSPDGKRIAFCARQQPKPPEGIDAEDERWTKRPLVLRRSFYKTDSAGWIVESRSHVYVADAKTGRCRRITDADADHVMPAWSPDGKRLAFGRSRGGARDAFRDDIWVADVESCEAVRVTENVASATAPAFSPDGRFLAFRGVVEPGDGAKRLWIVPADGSAVERAVTPSAIEVATFRFETCGPPVWSRDGEIVFSVLAIEGNSHVAAVHADGSAIDLRTRGDRQVTSLRVAANGTLAFTWAEAGMATGISVAAEDGTRETVIAEPNRKWREALEVPAAERRIFHIKKGIRDGWLFLPADRPARALPLLVDVHGGPHSLASIHAAIHPFWYVLLSRGWAVLALNTIGSTSYGRDMIDALRGRWGKADLDEHLAAVDALVEEGIVDPDRVAIAGKSYGGFLAAWAIGHTDRFRAAVIGAPVANLESHFGSSDSGHYVDPFNMRAEIWEARERYRELSPVQYVHRSTTPTLLLQGEDDRRCTLGQSEEIFQILMRAGRCPVEMVVYPDGDHHVPEQGRPSHRVDWTRRIVHWCERWVEKRKRP